MAVITAFSFHVEQRLIHAICISGLNVDVLKITYIPDSGLETKVHYDVFFEQNGERITAKGFKEEQEAKDYAFSFRDISEVKQQVNISNK